MNSIEEIASVLKGIGSAAIFTHVRPDGDTLGSGMALFRALTALGKKCEVLNEGEIPSRYTCFPCMVGIKQSPTFDAEAYICVDCSDEARLGELQRVFLSGRKKVTVNIDHHISNTRYCQYNYVLERASNCENIAALIHALGVPFDKEIATCLLIGMVTDSGAFSHADVDAGTLRSAAECLEAGASVDTVVFETIRRQSRGRASLYLAVLSRLRYLLGGRLAVAVVTQDDLSHYGVGQDATEGIVDFALTVDGVEVSVCLLEMKKGQYKASLRARRVSVNEIARVYGGGGHVLAAGCMLFGEKEEVLDRLSYTVSQWLP